MSSVEGALQPPKLPRNEVEKESHKRLIVVLEDACLETVKAGKAFQLLNCDDHISILRKNSRNLNDARPDITHQVC
jgi:rRNA small subunit pseudouridine methyltransferase Nep1